MCRDCGCSVVRKPVKINTYPHKDKLEHGHNHPLDHSHHHHHSHGNRTIDIKQSIFAKNDHLAERNRKYFLAQNLLVLNVVSSPGSGKTALLEKTVHDLKGKLNAAVIVGDLETDHFGNINFVENYDIRRLKHCWIFKGFIFPFCRRKKHNP